MGGLCSSAGGVVCAGGVDIIKLTKAPLIYSVSRFNLGGLGALFGGAKPTKAPHGDRTKCKAIFAVASFRNSSAQFYKAYLVCGVLTLGSCPMIFSTYSSTSRCLKPFCEIV